MMNVTELIEGIYPKRKFKVKDYLFVLGCNAYEDFEKVCNATSQVTASFYTVNAKLFFKHIYVICNPYLELYDVKLMKTFREVKCP